LVKIGGQIEHEYGNPQDIEWAFESGTFHILQSRGITTLYPPPPSPDGFKRCFISVGHMQVMTETILPLGMSFWGMMSEDVKIIKVGGRIYMEITHNLTSAAGKAVVRQKVSNSDVLMDDAINRVLTRKDYIKSIPKGKASNFAVPKTIIPALISGWSTYRANNPDMIKRYNKRLENNIEKSRSALDKLSGKAVLEFICEDMKSLMKDLLDPEGLGPLLVAFFMTKTLDRAGKELLNRDVVSGVVSKWLLVNITSEMGNGVSRIAGAARDYPEVIGYLENAGDAFELKTLRSIPGGEASAAEFELFFERFGMRCPGEIDITKPRFVEEPSKILSAVLADIKLPKGHASEKFENGKRESDAAVSELIAVAKVKWGAAKARKLEKQLSFYRNFLGLRESPKYFWMKRYWVYRQAIMRVAYDLAREGKIRRAGDIDYLDIDELIGLCEGRFTPDYEKIDALRKDYAHWATLTPPRLIFSDGEVVNGEYTRDIPEGALAGVAVSNGVAEGRARVILDIKDAHMIEEGDILVTRYTDPSWTPAFMSIGGLVTETGGMATHGAIITREYGLPCVVGVVNASRLIRDGQRIRINGDEGYAEIL
jgi:pyruvate,water dikinase